eukprot:Plantae.Rhodophyta-Hildenbrandia_rubra.ctg4813.p3 GENE.Plantae.Rhodophyta-Hildenbrandia_rubra.ctg4813~~Plantae.Rhodophyta-Hildenbrandia_rubra.ctg4813.p3  ORF type:complete len:191 (+),score=44.47 Plantae.Rhodophyta-Hildenbrandia_rubra.ctg4813:52-624(+)
MTTAARTHVYAEPKSFVLKEKVFSLSGDSFSIKDEHKNPVFKVKGKAISLSEKKTLLDTSGNPLYKMKEKIFSMHTRQLIYDAATDKVVVTLKRKSIIPGKGVSTVEIWKGEDDKADPWLESKGDILRHNFVITEKASGREVVAVKRDLFNIKSLLTDRDKYGAKVAANEDAALIVMLVVAIDEIFREEH